MFGVCLHYIEDSFIQNQWDYVMMHFNPDKIYLVVPEDFDAEECEWINNYDPMKTKGVTLIHTLDEIVEPRVILHPEGSTEIKSFVHPESAVYVFGSDVGIFEPTVEGKRIRIATHSDLPMYSFTAAAITFYDREVKLG